MICINLPRNAPTIFESIFRSLICAPAVATPPPPSPSSYHIFKTDMQKYWPTILLLGIFTVTVGYLCIGCFIESRFRTIQKRLEASGVIPSRESRERKEKIKKHGGGVMIQMQVQEELAAAREKSRAKDKEESEGRIVEVIRRAAPAFMAPFKRVEETLAIAIEGLQNLATGAYKGRIETKYMMHESKFVQTLLFYGPHAKQATWAREQVNLERMCYERMAALAKKQAEEREREALGEEFELVG
jgi:hypothetical protein